MDWVVVSVVIGALGLLGVGVQIYYARMQARVAGVAVPSTVSPQQERKKALDCYYVLIDSYEQSSGIEYGFTTISVDDFSFTFDANDTLARRVFILKGFGAGTYLIKAKIRVWNSKASVDYVAELNLGNSPFHHFRWKSSTNVHPSQVRHVSATAVSEAEFSKLTGKDFQLPSCSASPRGVSFSSAHSY